jgi:UDP-GlcNAc:undecaprenyl-phosphate GlcNAc-1-phosphate transferase
VALPTVTLVPLAALLGTVAAGGSRRLALRLGIVRDPDPFVAQHTRPVACLGGVALAAATAGALALDADRVNVSAAMVVGALLFLGTGLLDDVRGLSPARKLALQVVSATVAAALGATLAVSGNRLVDGAAAVVWVVVIVNAVNLTDVCDGLVTGVGVIALLALGATEPALWAPCLAVGGACLGILVFNAPPASIFLGDAGSHFLGFALAMVALEVVRTAQAANLLVSGALVIGVPLFELAFVTFARLKRHEPWWRGSADHFSLRLQAAGLSRWQTDAVAWTLAGALAFAGWSSPRLSAVGRISLVAVVVGALVLSSRLLLQWDASPTRRRSA